MQADKTHTLRIYCICGQKMKVSPDMFGRPGKCVTCRQKLRVPQADEIPDGATEIHLTDHPEFLRKVKPAVVSSKPESDVVHTAESYTELEVDGDKPHRKRRPLDILEPLRALVSLEYRLNHKRAMAEGDADGVSKTHYTLEQLDHYLEEVHLAREQLDETLRQHLLEVRLERATVEEQLSEAAAEARAGNVPFTEYLERFEHLSWRRDCLAHREANLRGWLAVRNPIDIGGYVRLPLDQLPDQLEKMNFANEPDEAQELSDYWVNRLRDELSRRERWRSKKKEAEDTGDESVEADHRRAEAESMMKLAKANVSFCRERLEQHEKDCAVHLAIIDRQLDLLRGRNVLGEIKKKEFHRREREMEQFKESIVRRDELLKRALDAETAEAVPRPHGTRISRIRAAHDAPEKAAKGRRMLWALVFVIAMLGAAFLGLLIGMSGLDSIRSFGFPPFAFRPAESPSGPVVSPPEPNEESEPEVAEREAVEPVADEEPAEEADPRPPEATDETAVPNEGEEVFFDEEFLMPPFEPESRDEIEVELRGILTMPGRPPQFAIHVHLLDGEVRPRNVSLGAPIYQTWYVAEYNPTQQTVTLSDGQSFLILRRGNPEPLSAGD